MMMMMIIRGRERTQRERHTETLDVGVTGGGLLPRWTLEPVTKLAEGGVGTDVARISYSSDARRQGLNVTGLGAM